ncbi:MAG: DNA polymerase/3'-5' exonuclease PolX [Methanoregulaceae archaeon]|nr:DNA polymerase/3'-5' exonuclease PolX [Methanoregulaceae archaeon]
MDITNQQVGAQLLLAGQLLEIMGENVFKIRAFYRASDIIERLAVPVTSLPEAELVRIQGIGKNIAHKIFEMRDTGTFTELETLKKDVPGPLLDLLMLDGVGPKTVNKLWKKLNVQSVDDLERAARGHRIRALTGFGEKKEAGFLAAIRRFREEAGRMNRFEADEVVTRVGSVMHAGNYEVAGSYRRGRSTIGDIDIVTTEPSGVLNSRLRQIADTMIDEGDRKTSFRCLGKRVDVRFTNKNEFGSMLVYLTGSKAFNIHLRQIAIGKGYKLNEYGIEEQATGKLHVFPDEQSLFAFLGLDNIPPELREDWGEVERAITHRLPHLVEVKDIRGDLHVHSSWSDGQLTIQELASTGELLGYEYLLCSDHSVSLGIAHGLDETALLKQRHEIERINKESTCQILCGTEVDILSDGTLGLPNTALRDLDLVIASVHSGLKQDRDQLTRRVIAAMENEHVDIIGHPTGRLIGKRGAYDIDLPRIIDRAAQTGTALECNASPYRLDIDDVHIRQAIEKGVHISVGTDTHNATEFAQIRYGVLTARRGWCTASDLLNTLTEKELLAWAG